MDWIKTGWGEDFLPRPVAGLPYALDITGMRYPEGNGLSVAIDTIHDIAANYPPPYHLLVSGGVDSQAMLYAWHMSGIDFTATTFQYLDRDGVVYNDHDLAEIFPFAQSLGRTVEVRQFALMEFLEGELPRYWKRYTCTSPQICTHMRFAEIITDGTCIYSGNFISPVPLDYTILGLDRFVKKSGRAMVPFFFLHSAELAGVMLGSSIKGTNYEDKCNHYRRHGFPVVNQPDKQTGFEKVKDYYDAKYGFAVSGLEKLRYGNMPSKRTFDILFRYRATELIKYVDALYIRGTQ